MFPTWDSDLFQIINQAHANGLDQAMVLISSKSVWIPFYAFLIYRLYKKYKADFWKPILYLISTVIFADQVSSSIFKPLFKRLRPCHVAEFQSWINLPDGCGGLYGFCSSHAANAFAVAIGYYLMTKNRTWGIALLIWACIISYSRIYLGAHFPLDVIVGAFLGMTGAIILHKIYGKLSRNS